MADLELENLYRQHRQGLFALAMSITRSQSAAEDAIHEAFVRLCRARIRVDDPAAYVFTAVRNAARDQTRRMRLHDELSGDLFDNQTRPDQAAQDVEMMQVVRDCLDELEPPSREAVVMKVYADLTFEQIAAVTGEPLQTVASRYRRALTKMREMLTARSQS